MTLHMDHFTGYVCMNANENYAHIINKNSFKSHMLIVLRIDIKFFSLRGFVRISASDKRLKQIQVQYLSWEYDHEWNDVLYQYVLF